MPVASTQPVYPPPPGQPVEAQWGIAVSETVYQRFTDVADRNTKWTAPPVGSHCVTTIPTLSEWIYNGTSWVLTGGMLIGEMKMWPAASIPPNWLTCNGGAVSRITYSALFAILGVLWGAGDGSTTFNLPDMSGRAPIGAGTGTGLTARTLGEKIGTETVALTATEMPSHQHDMSHTHTGATTNTESGHYHSGGTSIGGLHDHGTDNSLTSGVPPAYFVGASSAPIAGGVTVGSGGATQLYITYFDGTSFSGAHNHTFTTTTPNSGHYHSVTIPAVTQNTSYSGGGAAHNNIQPVAVVNYIIFAGV